MDGTAMTPAHAAEAAQHIAALRGLYGDLGDVLEDNDRSRGVWAQITASHAQLAGILRSRTQSGA
jgi:hypothetical protein